MKLILHICAIALSILSARSYGEAASYPPLPALNIDISQTSVSGLSSGGFMAVQLAVAYSSIIKGVGVVAAGPYYCSQNDVLITTSRCSCTIEPASACEVNAGSTDVPKLVSLTRTFFWVDPVTNEMQQILRVDPNEPPVLRNLGSVTGGSLRLFIESQTYHKSREKRQRLDPEVKAKRAAYREALAAAAEARAHRYK